MIENTIVLEKEELSASLPRNYFFICFASFEERSTIAALSLNINQVAGSVTFKSRNSDNDYALDLICKKLINTTIIELNLNNPVNIAQGLTECVKSLIARETIPLVIDITTFTHEILAMFLKLLFDNNRKFPNVFLLYNGAQDYSDSISKGRKQMWLSKGCRDVRNIIGYSGKLSPAAKTSLIVLTGFELERATGMIEILEPDKLILGVGIDPINDNNKITMEHFREEFLKWKLNYKNSSCFEFEFSCKDINNTITMIEDLILSNPNDNYIIVPLNTKLSTVATALVALRNPKIQLCYAIPELYNVESYSKPSNHMTLLNLSMT